MTHYQDLGCAFGRAGLVSWVVQYRVGLKQRRITLGSVAELDISRARKAAEERLAAATLGDDPQQQKIEARVAPTLDLVIAQYLAAKKSELRPSTYYANNLYLCCYWKPLHRMRARDLTRRHVAARLGEIVAEHTVTTGIRR